MRQKNKSTRKHFIRRGLTALLAAVLIPLSTAISKPTASPKKPKVPRMNIVFVLTDDQRWDTLWAMPILKEKLASRGVTFTNAFVTNPICTPCRGSILCGGNYSHNTGINSNRCFAGKRDEYKRFNSETLAKHLQDSGYRTGFVGKYIHGFRPGDAPEGWDSFVANENGGVLHDWNNLKDITIADSREPNLIKIVREHKQYITDFQKDKALDFLESAKNDGQPFFLYVCTYAPHSPSIPCPEDKNKFLDFKHRGGAFLEEDLSDKPKWVQEAGGKIRQFGRGNLGGFDAVNRTYLESIAPIDRTIGSIVEKLEELDALDNTVIIFSSDNGYLRGEHGLENKGMPYEEAIRVPLVMYMPGNKTGNDNRQVAVDLDIPATIYDIAGISGRTQGHSLLPALQKKEQDVWRDTIIIESHGYLADYWGRKYGFKPEGLGFWKGLRVQNDKGTWKYVEHPTGEKELYDLVEDPYEEENLANQLPEKVEELGQKLEATFLESKREYAEQRAED